MIECLSTALTSTTNITGFFHHRSADPVAKRVHYCPRKDGASASDFFPYLATRSLDTQKPFCPAFIAVFEIGPDLEPEKIESAADQKV